MFSLKSVAQHVVTCRWIGRQHRSRDAGTCRYFKKVPPPKSRWEIGYWGGQSEQSISEKGERRPLPRVISSLISHPHAFLPDSEADTDAGVECIQSKSYDSDSHICHKVATAQILHLIAAEKSACSSMEVGGLSA
jgi:hypothetical protein